MKVALVHEWLTGISGSERVLLEIAKLFPEAPIYTAVFRPEQTKPFVGREVITSFLQNIPLMKSKRELLIPFAPFAFEQFNLSKYDLVISSSHIAAKGVLTKPETIHISYCHTPPRYLWEPNLDSRASQGRFTWLRRNIAHKMRLWDRLAADRVDYFLANSYFVRKRIQKYYKREAVVIYPPVDTSCFKPADKSEIKDYFLFVSRLVGYKRCDLVVRAFNDLNLPLKIIGRGPERNALVKKAKKNIEFLGFLSDEEIKRYYAKARAFVFPAEEDFGIVPIEAMASGRPVIAYNGGGTAETVIDGVSGKLFPEQTPQCLIDAVRNFKPERFDPKKIRQHAEKFSSERFRREMKREVEGIIERKQRKKRENQ